MEPKEKSHFLALLPTQNVQTRMPRDFVKVYLKVLEAKTSIRVQRTSDLD